MHLTLEIIGPQVREFGVQSRKVFGTAGGTIGRRMDNDWVLPGEHISSRHARITFSNGSFMIEDTSMNGVFINLRQMRLKQGEPRKLANGDHIFIDEVEITVAIDADGAEPVASRQEISLPPPFEFPWTTALTPPLPLEWPPRRLVCYRYASRLRRGLCDACEVSEPLARICGGEEVAMAPVPTSWGMQGVRPLTRGETDFLAEVKTAGSPEDLLTAAIADPDIALLARRYFCFWASNNGVIARQVLRWHPEFVAFLDCPNVPPIVEPKAVR
jgi:hypothetical protein